MKVCTIVYSILCANTRNAFHLWRFMMSLPETKPKNAKTPVVAELMGICPNQPCKLSVLSLSYVINVSQISMSDDL